IEEVTLYAMGVLKLAQTNNCTKVICNETELKYELSTIDTYELAEQASQHANSLKKIAIICHKSYAIDGRFFETVAKNRGLTVLVTHDSKLASNWLNE
ncbi:MAG: hypothetical protein ACPGLV_17375, partial [Bacteroidia bacterium]